MAKATFRFVIPALCLLTFASFGAVPGYSQTGTTPGVTQEKLPEGTSDKAFPTQLSGTVVDMSGAVLAGATVQVLRVDGVVQKTTRSNRDGSFAVSGLSEGEYRLVVSSPDFEPRETPLSFRAAGKTATLRVSLAVRSVSTTVDVHGRADDLVGIASSAGEVTVGAVELKNRPILRSGEILEGPEGPIMVL